MDLMHSTPSMYYDYDAHVKGTFSVMKNSQSVNLLIFISNTLIELFNDFGSDRDGILKRLTMYFNLWRYKVVRHRSKVRLRDRMMTKDGVTLDPNQQAGRPLRAYDLGVATPRALVYAGVMTNGDARSWYMISGDAKSWGEVENCNIPMYLDKDLPLQAGIEPKKQIERKIRSEGKECANLFLSGRVYSQAFHLGGQGFFLSAHCNMDQQSSFHCFGLFLGMQEKGSVTFAVDYEFAARSKPTEEYISKYKGNYTFTGGKAVGYRNLFATPWTSFMAEDSLYFINGILHLRAELTIRH
ncbi:BTB/POZ domain-containing protein POB1-like protein [Tanacetum coccineum]